MSQDERDKILTQLGGFVYELSSLRFSKIGSEHGDFEIGQCLRIATLLYGRAEKNVPRGPFSTAKDYYSVFAAVQADDIWHTDLFGGSFFDPLPRWEDFPNGFKDPEYRLSMDAWNKRADYIVDSVENKVDYKIFADLLAEMIPDMAHDSQNDEFPLEHSDLGIQNMFVDDEFNITCIIDWELCSTVPLETLITHAPLPA